MPGPNTPHVAHSSSVLADGSTTVVIGGYSIVTGQPVTTNTVEVYSMSAPQLAIFPTLSIASGGPKTNTQAFLPASRVEHTAVVWENAIYIYAGTNTGIMGDLWRLLYMASSPHALNASVGDQVVNASTYVPIARTGHSTTMFFANATTSIHLVYGGTLAYTYENSNDTLFMVLTKPGGGAVGCQSAVPSVRWLPVTLVGNGSRPLARSYHSMTLNANGSTTCFVLYGGHSFWNSTIFDDVWTLCPVANQTASVERMEYVWSKLPQLGSTPPPRFGHTAIVSYTNRFVVLGGSYTFPSDYMSDAWEFNMDLTRWMQLSLSYTNGTLLSPRRSHTSNYLKQSSLVILGGIGRYALVAGNVIECAYTAAQCPVGFVQSYCDATGQIVCEPCPPGYYAANGAASCSMCPAGTYAVAGSVSCTPCPLGTYSPQLGAPSIAACLSCPKGTYSSVMQAISVANCTVCPAGTFSAQVGTSACTPCSSGYYSSANASQCAGCPVGTFSNSQAASCTNCSAGTFSPAVAMGACLSCPRGMYSNMSARRRKEAASYARWAAMPHVWGSRCPDGSYSTIVGSALASSCKLCPAGAYSNSNTRASVLPVQSPLMLTLPVHIPTEPRYNPHTGATSCISCPLNFLTVATGANASTLCQSCAVGTQLNSATLTCQACPPGTHRLDSTAGCAICPMGTFTATGAAAQSSQCTPCDAMTFSNISGATQCAACATGTYALSKWSQCLPCAPLCPVGRNGGVCSYHGSCSYGGCSCNAGFTGVACQTPSPLVSVNATNSTGVLYFATPNMTMLFDNVSNTILIGREGGALGTLSAVVSIVGGNATATNGGLPVGWSTVVSVATQQLWLNVSLPLRAVLAQGCASLVLALSNVNASAAVSNVSVTDAAVVMLLVQATGIPSTTLLQLSAAPVSTAVVQVATTQSSSVVVPLPAPAVTLVESYVFADGSWNQSLTPLLPAVMGTLQVNFQAAGKEWKFLSNLNTTPAFGHDTASLPFKARLRNLMGMCVKDGRSDGPINERIQGPDSARRGFSVGSAVEPGLSSDAPDLYVGNDHQRVDDGGGISEPANVVPYFIVPSSSAATFSAFAQNFGITIGYNYSSFATAPWQALQTPLTPIVGIISNPSSGLLQSATWANGSVTLSFRRAALGSDPAQMTSVLTVLGSELNPRVALREESRVTMLQLVQLTFVLSCVGASAAPSLPAARGWVGFFASPSDLQAAWVPTNVSMPPVALLSSANQSFSLTANTSYVQSLTVQLEPSAPVVVAGYVNFPNQTTNASMLSSASMEFVVSPMRYPIPLPSTTVNSSATWQFFATVIKLPAATTQLQLALNAFGLVQLSGLGVFPDGKYSCSCDAGFFMRNGVCTRCPTGSACAAGIKQACAQQTFSFGAFAACKPCYAGWTCSGGFATPCPAGTYTLDATSCLPCPAGSACLQGLRLATTVVAFTTGCSTVCDKGTFAPERAGVCSRCLPGTFANTSGSTSCLACPPGSTSSFMRDHCIPCAAGSVAAASATFPCVACSVKSFAGVGQSACTACPSGAYTPTRGSQQCEVCEASSSDPQCGGG
ncbi:hypothetical protein ACHHYP_03569 [Achlya hypogyna]|uniref:Tyrosine-protein kinase ephrin type A/B receptor-like domain-containing protein n=1 Tax=Achlya hypogyna TaxID=1202772 RepID=A0A1V9ZR10_ACHHY|nr:hypothetical protein ACHHYP_03569 [Achlya hypogyna]